MWILPTEINLWPNATEAEARDWWEGIRHRHNALADRFNRDRRNTHYLYFFKRKEPRQLAYMPTYEYVMKSYRRSR